MNSNTQVAISLDFFEAYSALPKQVRNKVRDFMVKFQSNPELRGFNYEKIHACADKKMCSVRIDDTYRGIVARQPDTGSYILLWVDHHDEAYDWARRKSSGVNPRTGALHVVDAQQLGAYEEPAWEQGNPTRRGLFAEFSKKDLMRIGVPENLMSAVQSIACENDLNARKGAFPAEVFEALEFLAAGFSLNEVIREMHLSQDDHDENFAEALRNPITLQSFVVIDDNEELRRMLDAPLETWRVFLHPAQRRIVNRDYSGPARVLGGAGTGKTVVAMHRAKRLAAALTGDEKILFTTFTRNLPVDVLENLRKICTPQEIRRIDVRNIDDWALDYLRGRGDTVRVVLLAKERRQLWEAAIARSGVSTELPPSFFEDEYNRVILASEDTGADAYACASRAGRGVPLSAGRRRRIWGVFQAYMDILKEENAADGQTLLHRCAAIVKAETTPYRHVIVDEAQDLGPAALRLLRTIAGPEHPNDLFLVGDSRQRIYRTRTTLAQAGINVRGRSSTLRINYRTTEETRDFAFALLDGIQFDDLDAGRDTSDRCRSMTHGYAPVIMEFESADEEFEALYDEISRLRENGTSLQNICVLARTNALVDNYVRRFRERSMPCYEIRAQKTDDQELEGVRVATMHRAKGLEFQYVFVVSANKGQIPHNSAIDRTNAFTRAESVAAEKCLVYVALTRAQKGAYVMGYGEMSDMIPRAGTNRS